MRTEAGSTTRTIVRTINRGKGTPMAELELGEPLTIVQVATLIGCSPWTVRQRHMRGGLPYFRAGVNGKLIFYKDQVVRWIESKQKGGKAK